MELELKHIAAYLPFSAKIHHSRKNGFFEVLTATGEIADYIVNEKSEHDKYALILRAMSDLNTTYFSDLFDEDIDVRTFLNEEFLESRGIKSFQQLTEFKIEWLPFGVINLLIKHHFDVFDLIPQGLAIDIHSLSSIS